jgi:hypothetical protein
MTTNNSVPQQMALDIFSDLSLIATPITEIQKDIGYNKSNLLIDVSDLSLVARRVLNGCYFLAAENPQQSYYDLPVEFFKWLINYDSRNHAHLKKAIREAQKASVVINIIDSGNSKMDKWASVPMLGSTAISNGRVAFKIPEEVRHQLHNPLGFTYLSLRITAAFNSQYAITFYEKLSALKNQGGSEWLEIEKFKEWIGVANVKSYEEYKALRRNVIDPSVAQVNDISDIFVVVDVKRTARKISHIRFLVKDNPNGKFVLRMDYRKSIQELYDTLVKEFGLSEDNLSTIIENRVEWTNERIQMAIEFTRFRMKQAPGKIKYPGIYLMNAIDKGFSLADAEKKKVAQADVVEKNPELDVQKNTKDAETRTVLEKARKALALLSEERKQEIACAYSKSSASVILRGETDPEKILNHPRARAGFAVFLLKAIC